ncbi:MAG: hypothetical protein P8Z00_21610 [Anaerolineales bacterium]|jgi:hypothetical protein
MQTLQKSMQVSRMLKTIALLVLFTAAGCRGLLSFSPERAVVQTVLSSNTFGMQAQPDTVQVLQSKTLEGNQFVQVAFQAVDERGLQQECLFVYETRRTPVGFVTGSGGGGCGPTNQPDEAPIGISVGSSGGAGVVYTEADGFVYQPEIASLEVIWEDGEKQAVEVVNGAYLALRSGRQALDQIKALDAAGEVVYTHESGPPIPEKQP